MTGKKASVVSTASASASCAQAASYTAPSSTTLSRALGMRYAEDLRTLGFLAAYVALSVFMWRHHADQRIPSLVWTALWWLTTWLSFTGAVATHNTIHCKIFNHNLGNSFMRFALTLWYGHPCSTFVPGHNLSHHRYTQMVNDLMQTSVAQYKPNILNLFLFHPRIVSGVMKSDITYMLWMGKKGRRMFHEWLSEGLVLIAVTVTLIVLSPSKWLFYFMAPHYVAQFCIVTINLLQHDGCDIVLPRVDDASPADGDMYADHMAPPPPDLNKIREENALPESTLVAPIATPLPGAKALTFKERVSTFNTARNFVSPTLNWLLMNNGYHTVHHHRPYLHWSLLPEAHAREVKPHIHPALDQASIWGYMFEQYVYPGVRTDYLGKPVVFDRTMDESACGDWMNMPAADKTTVDSMDTRTRLRFVADGALVVLIKIISPMYSPFAAAD